MDSATKNEEKAKILDSEDACSIGSSKDLLSEKDEEKDRMLDENRLGFNLPTNDKSKSGDLDNLSVDSYWIDDDDENKLNENENQNDDTLEKIK